MKNDHDMKVPEESEKYAEARPRWIGHSPRQAG